MNERISREEIHEQVERIVQSRTFRSSHRLQQFLRYITELTVAGEASKINEYLLGVEVFERGADYNTAEDSVVRRQAHALRRKLSDYYASEGRRDRLVVEVPVGRYVPVFTSAAASAKATADAADRAADASPAAAGGWSVPGWAALAAALLVGLIAFWTGRGTAPADRIANEARREARLPDALRELWGPWLNAERGPLICFSTPLTAIIKDFPEKLRAPSAPTLPDELEDRFSEVLKLSPDGHHYIWPTKTEAKAGEALAAVQLSGMFAMLGLPPRATLSSLITWGDFRRESIILFGHNEQNQWVDALLDPYPLRLRQTTADRERYIQNVAPRAGELDSYEIHYPSDPQGPVIEYALVSMLPGTDGLHQLLIVSGLNTGATLMAVEFMTNEDRVEALLNELRRHAPSHEGPWRFQLVLRAEVHNKVVAGGSIEMIRILDSLPDELTLDLREHARAVPIWR